jgi:hypothetical protein
VRVVVANEGNAPVRNPFFVDVYINPRRPPAKVNETWDVVGDKGLVWGVSGPGLDSLVPGGSLVLNTISDPYFAPDLSSSPWSPGVGAKVYAQVDSYNDPPTAHGIVLETHEISGEAYNNIFGPVTASSSAAQDPSFDPATANEPVGPAANTELPSR